MRHSGVASTSGRLALLAAIALTLCDGAFAGERRPLRAGDSLPRLPYTDIDGAEGSTGDPPGWIQVVTFADRDSSEPMTEWLRRAQIRTARKHPELRVAYIGFADVSGVPGFLRGLVRPLLRRAYDRSNARFEQSFREAGLSEPDPSRTVFHFTPDWDGRYLEAFGLEDAKSFHCWIVVDGVVVSALDASTPEPAVRYVEAFAAVASAR